MDVKYYECHVTLASHVPGLGDVMRTHRFKSTDLADEHPICTAKDKDYAALYTRMGEFCLDAMSVGAVIERQKIEAVVLDERF